MKAGNKIKIKNKKKKKNIELFESKLEKKKHSIKK